MRGLQVRYGEFVVVQDVSLTVAPGEIVALLGPNGAGKTTTLRAVHGIIPPVDGEITYEGRALHGMPTHERVALGLGLVPEGRELFPGMTVEENLELGHVPGRGPALADSLADVYRLFPLLRERRRQQAGTLSGGEQQMLAIGRALMAAPTLLMLDEPSLGLAPRIVDLLYDTLRLLGERGLALLIVEQYVHEALALAARGYVLESGRIVLHGPSAQLREHPNLQQTYLSV
ncbi:MAG: ABC transporter ATP-binding protein [Armatimonadota bacterium]|nr:ABC transporter ATP-binding protein [Armatimonadota bacterium]MDR7422608.1 ABC transporter ATP-binding protein [Armatimonadota bacterium]MDR7453569.1 ABC transporter ATP-binding protein [Armatimonadota bacterium]MDR7456385.1 ABC transporter ATP-binding protein [Armatimonadota bacterium]MDR7496681.1 ABC transporter ATP-binding protein [Armatimonadota bacterium]